MDHAQNVFESPGISTTYTNAPTVGWTRQLTPLVTLSLQAGLQFSTDGSVGAYANASLSYEYKVADRLVRASVAYVHSEGFVVGQAGPTTTATLSNRIAFSPPPPLPGSLGRTNPRVSQGKKPKRSGTPG